MPLYVTNGKLQLGEPGQLAAQRACCCDEEGDNPEDCVCPDFCIYQFAVIQPLAAGPFPSLPCSYSSEPVRGNSSIILCDGTQATESYEESWQKWTWNWIFRSPILSSANYLSQSWYNITSDTSNRMQVAYQASIKLFCDLSLTEPSLYLVCDWLVNVIKNDKFAPYVFPHGKSVFKTASIDLSHECLKKSNATCDGIASIRAGFITSVPLEITLSESSANGLAWETVQASQYGDQSEISDCFDNIVENFSATFRITQRQSCRIVNCDCSTSLDGLKATFEGKEFTLGTESSYSELFDDYELVTAHYMDFSGNYVFEKYQVMAVPAGAIGDVQMVVIYCETDNQADPPVSRWYARYESICRKYEAGGTGVVLEETKKTEIGYLPCSESAGCAGRTENDPVPLGSPIDVEEIEGSPETTDGTAACTPPARADLTIFEDCG